MAKRGGKGKDKWKKKRRQEYLEQKEFRYYIFYAGEYVLGYRDGNRSYLNRPVGKRFFIRLRSDNRMVSHDEISKLWGRSDNGKS